MSNPMSNNIPVDYAAAEDLLFDPSRQNFFIPTTTWPVSMDPVVSAPVSDTASPTHSASPAFTVSSADLLEWPLMTTAEAQPVSTAAPVQHFPHMPHNPALIDTQFGGIYSQPIHTSPVDLLPPTTVSGSMMDNSYMALPAAVDPQWAQWQMFAIEHSLNNPVTLEQNMTALSQTSMPEHSPASTYIELRSTGSSNGEWTFVDAHHRVDFNDINGAIFNPEQTLHNPGEALHIRTDSSHSDSSNCSWYLSGDEMYARAITSPESDSHVEHSPHSHGHSPAHSHDHHHHHSVSPPSIPLPEMSRQVSQASSPISRPTPSSTSTALTRKSPSTKTSKPAIRRRSDPTKKDTEKRVGRRRGPLLPEQRKQASEIRKLRACLRCKFLKKTCDKGEPCAGCQPSHARLWQVPCTRIDIKDINYFMKDFKADYERHVTMGFSVSNIKGFSSSERSLYITHGYGFVLPITAREVFVRDEECFRTDWLEDDHDGALTKYKISTAGLTAGVEGIPAALLSEYLDRHVDGPYEKWVDEFFDGTPFLTELLKTAHRYYTRERTPVVRKALKLVLAYNLTQHVTLVEGLSEEEQLEGRIEDERSRFYGKTFAPVMINFQVKCALADMWRELQKEVLEELSALYSGVYNGDKLKNWPTIFLLAAILLGIWEEMQFDCHYRVPDATYTEKFCHDMETTPVGVIVGLFAAISQKLPTFSEWDTRKHHHLLNSNPAVCDAMTEMRQHVGKYDTYLRSRSESKFDADDFDCLSNKFVSKLVIRA